MNFISNHDENSWNGTEQERMGDAVPLFQAFCYVVPGMPMIYTGQLSGNHHRLEFFEKDLIDTDENYEKHTEVIADGYFHESEYRSAPYFDITDGFDGITLLDTSF